jgi:hypothetical protein
MGTVDAQANPPEEAGMSRKVHRLVTLFAVALLFQLGESLGADWRSAMITREGASALRPVEPGGTADRIDDPAREAECIPGPLSSANQSALSEGGSIAFAPAVVFTAPLDLSRMNLGTDAIEISRFLKSK